MLKACLGNVNIWVGKVMKLVLEGTLTALDVRLAACFLCVLLITTRNTPYQTRSSCNLERVSFNCDSAEFKQ